MHETMTQEKNFFPPFTKKLTNIHFRTKQMLVPAQAQSCRITNGTEYPTVHLSKNREILQSNPDCNSAFPPKQHYTTHCLASGSCCYSTCSRAEGDLI